MEAAMNLHNMTKAAEQTDTAAKEGTMTILEATPGQTYTIKEINTEDEEMNGFLFRLGCYSGEPITLISKKKKSCIVVIKDGRYNLDNLLAEAILV
jgi:ferrous iron transport protein A